jgi:hypothetical protein
MCEVLVRIGRCWCDVLRLSAVFMDTVVRGDFLDACVFMDVVKLWKCVSC